LIETGTGLCLTNQFFPRGVPHLKIVILPLLAHLAWKRLQTDRDLLLIKLRLLHDRSIPKSKLMECCSRIFCTSNSMIPLNNVEEWTFIMMTPFIVNQPPFILS